MAGIIAPVWDDDSDSVLDSDVVCGLVWHSTSPVITVIRIVIILPFICSICMLSKGPFRDM